MHNYSFFALMVCIFYIEFLYLFTIITSPTGTHGSKIYSRFHAAKKNLTKSMLCWIMIRQQLLLITALVSTGWWCIFANQYFRTLSNNFDYRIKLCSVRLFLVFFVGGIMSYLRRMYLFVQREVKHIVLFFCFFFLRLLCLILQVSLDVPSVQPLQYALTFVTSNNQNIRIQAHYIVIVIRTLFTVCELLQRI